MHAYYDFFTGVVQSVCFEHELIEKNNLNNVTQINNFLLITASTQAFAEITKSFRTLSRNQPVNVTVLLLPKYNSKNFKYYNVFGDDFINKKEHLLK